MQGEPGTCAIRVKADELHRWGFKVSGHVTMDARIVSQASAKLRNLTGYCDHHTLMLQYGGHTRYDMGRDLAYRLRFARIYGKPVHSQLTLHQSNNDCRHESSYNELVRGANFDLISCAPPTTSRPPHSASLACRLTTSRARMQGGRQAPGGVRAELAAAVGPVAHAGLQRCARALRGPRAQRRALHVLP